MTGEASSGYEFEPNARRAAGDEDGVVGEVHGG